MIKAFLHWRKRKKELTVTPYLRRAKGGKYIIEKISAALILRKNFSDGFDFFLILTNIIKLMGSFPVCTA